MYSVKWSKSIAENYYFYYYYYYYFLSNLVTSVSWFRKQIKLMKNKTSVVNPDPEFFVRLRIQAKMKKHKKVIKSLLLFCFICKENKV